MVVDNDNDQDVDLIGEDTQKEKKSAEEKATSTKKKICKFRFEHILLNYLLIVYSLDRLGVGFNSYHTAGLSDQHEEARGTSKNYSNGRTDLGSM